MSTLVAKDTFAGPNMRLVTKGDLVDSTDEIVKGREALFETVEEAAARPSEVIHTATVFPDAPAVEPEPDEADEVVRTPRGRSRK